MRRAREYRMMADINVTNLVDVVLVLLIVFMISAPLLQTGIDIDLPTTTYADEDIPEGIVVTVNKNGGIFIDDVFCRPENLEKSLTDYIGKKGISSIYLRGDQNVNYGSIIDVLARLKKMGIADVGLVTKPYEEEEES
jgi:biopolymer transport protein TolR